HRCVLEAWKSVVEAEAPIERGYEPQRPDQQELHILEEGRPLAFIRMPDELPDPGGDEDRERGRPERERQIGQRLDDDEHYDERERNAEGEPRRQRSVVGERGEPQQ